MSDENWRTPVTGEDYLLHERKRVDLEQRRPTIRTASDLVGPGIGAGAVRITDYDDLLATFNGYYSSLAGADSAPNETEQFVGYVISDAELGGRQVFTGLVSGNTYTRVFTRSPTDPETIGWGSWSGQRIAPTITGYDRTATFCQPGTPTVLLPPPVGTVGDSGVYEVSPGGIRVRQQGVYTGHIQVGDYVGGATGNVYVRIPDRDDTVVLGYLSQDLAPTVQIPFTVIATNADTGFAVTFMLDAGSPTSLDIWWRFSCTRVGDAV